jgi:DNA repair exonuclease SbcCD ATPase subunit
MFENLSSSQKAVSGVVVIAGVVGWIFAFVQIAEIDNLKSEVEPARQRLASAKDELAQLQGDLKAAQNERSQFQQQVKAAGSLEDLTAELEAVNAELQSLPSKIEGLQAELEAGSADLQSLKSEIESSQAELEPLRVEIQRQQALLDGSTLQFRTTTRAKVRAGPGTDTDEVAVVPPGKTLQVFEIVEGGSWYKVGGMGYIFHELVEPVEPVE